MSRESRAATALLLLLSVGVPAPGQTAASAPDRSKPPALGPVRPLQLPPVQKLRLSNGLPVLVVELHEVPVVQVNVVVDGRHGRAALARLDETFQAARG